MNIQEPYFLKGIGGRVRETRQSHSLTQAELADKCGLHRTFIGSAEVDGGHACSGPRNKETGN